MATRRSRTAAVRTTSSRKATLAARDGGLLGFRALLSPYGVPLDLTMVCLGLWMIRSERRRPRVS
jgi:hypothetical protein